MRQEKSPGPAKGGKAPANKGTPPTLSGKDNPPEQASGGSNPLDRLPVLDPHIRLFGSVDETMFQAFIGRLDDLRSNLARDQPILLCLTTTGGEADTARRIADEIMLVRRVEGRPLYFIGKSAVYSAGITIMSAFRPSERLLTEGTELLVHERHVEMTVQLRGGLRASMDLVRDVMAQLESGTKLERDGFEDLVKDSRCSLEQLLQKVMHKDWYLTAAEALELGLVAKVV